MYVCNRQFVLLKEKKLTILFLPKVGFSQDGNCSKTQYWSQISLGDMESTTNLIAWTFIGNQEFKPFQNVGQIIPLFHGGHLRSDVGLEMVRSQMPPNIEASRDAILGVHLSIKTKNHVLSLHIHPKYKFFKTLVKCSNTCTISMIYIQVTICICKNNYIHMQSLT